MITKKEQLFHLLARFSALIGLVLYLVGVAWFCLLSQDEFNHQTYMSENALLVGQVSEKFDDSVSLNKYAEELSKIMQKDDPGNIQAGLNVEFAHSHSNSIDIASEGINGLLANLDLVNTATRLAMKHGITPVVNGQEYSYSHSDVETRKANARGLFQAVWTQASGSPAGLHGLLINYQIPAVTLRSPSKKFGRSVSKLGQSTKAGRYIESILRSLNNMQERLHQSFWYYLLPNTMRYISIGVYMPPVLILIGSLLIKCLGIWVSASISGKEDGTEAKAKSQKNVAKKLDQEQDSDSTTLRSDADQTIRRRGHQVQTKKTEKGAIHNKSKKTKASKQFVPMDGIPPTLNRLAIWIVISAASGLCLHASPPLVFIIFQHPYWVDFEYRMGMQPMTGEFLATSLLILFGVLTLITPLLVAIGKRLLVGRKTKQSNEKAQPQPWSSSIVLVLWALFLACTACLNVSSSLLMSVGVVPVLLLFVRPARGKCISALFAIPWTLLSPPALLLMACAIQMYFVQQQSINWNDPASMVAQLWDACARALVQMLLEADLFGCWTWSIMTAGYSSLWMLTWSHIWSG